MRTHRQPEPEQTAAAPQWDCTVLAAGRARGLAGKASASLEPAAFAPWAPRQWCALRAGLRPPLTRCPRRSNTDPHRQLGRCHNPPQGGLHALTPTPSTTLQAYAAPTPRRRSRSPKRPVTIRRNVGHVQPKRPVTFAEIRTCLDSVTKTSAYGVDLASPPLLLRNRPSGPSMCRNVPENAKCVQHVLGPETAYGFTECLPQVQLRGGWYWQCCIRWPSYAKASEGTLLRATQRRTLRSA